MRREAALVANLLFDLFYLQRSVLHMKKVDIPINERLAVKPAEAFELLSISTATGYRLIKTGEIQSIKVGSRILVPVEGLKKLISI